MRVFENGIEVRNFSLKGQAGVDSSVDIVFALDITASMDEEINAVKSAIRGFVGQLDSRNIKARLCAVTFKDEIYDKCPGFVEDDPRTVRNENLDWFEDYLARLKPGGGGKPLENSLGGLLEASRGTGWGTHRQRAIILITDINFWFLPNHRNEPEARWAPYYDDVTESLEKSGALVFPITPRMHAYASDFYKKPQVTKINGGEWFDLRELERGRITMDGIFNKIGQYIVTDYAIEYAVEDNPGLDPYLPMSQRKISVQPVHPVIAGLTVGNARSNWPNGRPLPKREFLLQSGVKVGTERVSVNGQPVRTGYVIKSDTLVFDQAPAPGAQIRIQYERMKLRDHVQLRSLFLSGQGRLSNMRVFLNGSWAPADRYRLSTTTQGGYVLDLTDLPFDESDPYNIRGKGYLDIAVEYSSER